ncbi:MAG: plasmid pRiA4b ORF-3 family protein [Treponema sp.]|jgi:hypothetical protein|nr:plasmid pRiA4b ORF-3 family protein [Treponema sp.]
MTEDQKENIFDFLKDMTEPFTLEDVSNVFGEGKWNRRLEIETAALIDSWNIAFRLDRRRWISRRGCFEPVPFVISPTRLELLNGILVPGHRCVPFANPVLSPHKYVFYWKGRPIPVTSTEGPPEDFYPYYCLFGEEYAPQYIAQDNSGNKAAYSDPYEDPLEVSIRTLDMRRIYRESGFVPGDRFVARTRSWENGGFELERVGKDEWSQAELYAWFEVAEDGFEDSIAILGPGASTEEQIAYAYWYGGSRMRDVPAYALEEFLYERTDRIETVPYGIESRFWYAGKEIPDNKDIETERFLPGQTEVEDILFRRKIPVSELMIHSYVLDALFREDEDIQHIISRIVPPVIHLDGGEQAILAGYIKDDLEDFRGTYRSIADQSAGPIRQRVGELHTAVIDLAARLRKRDIDASWLPKHTFIALSQIQSHAAGLLEDLAMDEFPLEEYLEEDKMPEPSDLEVELEDIDNALDSMIETYEDIKELINDAMDNFRRNRLSVVRRPAEDGEDKVWRTVQISISGTGVWRRAAVPESCRLEELHRIIQVSLNWKDRFIHRFSVELPGGGPGRNSLNEKQSVKDIVAQGIAEMVYEYGTKWTIKIIILSCYEAGKDEVIRCVAGADAAPPEMVEGPLRFRKILAAFEPGGNPEKPAALRELGQNFKPGLFDMERCNRNLHVLYT